jgi:hypothetical protein
MLNVLPPLMFQVGAVLGRLGLREVEVGLPVCRCVPLPTCWVDSDSDDIALVLMGEGSSSQKPCDRW